MAEIDSRIEKWQKRLLDLGKKNRLINFWETKRSTLKIVNPEIDNLYSELVMKSHNLEFLFPEISELQNEEDLENEIEALEILKGDITTNQEFKDQQATLRNLRNRARTALEEQGVNILFVTFGLLNYKENETSSVFFSAPIILVPVKIELRSISSPFILSVLDDEIVINPTLAYKLEHEYNLKIPEFEPEDNNILSYLEQIEKLVQNNSWKVIKQANLGLFSFLKINIYKDIDRNKEKIKNHFLIGALVEKNLDIEISENLNNYDHDNLTHPKDTFQIVDADSSQQDAILFAKKGISFVLQGPPGTGKSQTITNIIAEKLADGKKVLFVSEKMAALEVVLKRLTHSKLNDFCLPLHSHRANKKQVLEMLEASLKVQPIRLVDEARKELNLLTNERKRLNDYANQLNTPILPLNKSIYFVNGYLSKLENVQDINFSLPNINEIDADQFIDFNYALKELATSIEKMQFDYLTNPWKNCILDSLNYDIRQQIQNNLSKLIPSLFKLSEDIENTNRTLKLNRKESITSLGDLIQILDFASTSRKIPISWIYKEEISELFNLAGKYRNLSKEYHEIKKFLEEKYNSEYFSIPADRVLNNINKKLDLAKKALNHQVNPDFESIITNLDDLLIFSKKSYRKINELAQIQNSISPIVDIKTIESLQDAINVEKLFSYLIKNPKPTEAWLNSENFNIIEHFFKEATEKHEKTNSIYHDIISIFEKDIFELDYKHLLTKFRTEYNSWTRIFNSEYKKDKRQIRGLAIDNKKNFSYEDILTLLRTLQIYFENKNWIFEKEEKLISFFGWYYKGLDTNWNELKDDFNVFKKIISYYDYNKNSNLQKTKLLNNQGNINQIQGIYEKLASIDTTTFVKEIREFFSKVNLENFHHLNKTEKIFEMMIKILSEIKDILMKLSSFEKNKLNFQQKKDCLEKLAYSQNIVNNFSEANNELQNKFEYFYNGINTDWNVLDNSLKWAKSFIELKDEYLLTKSFMTKICLDDDAIEYAKEKLITIKEEIAESSNTLNWFVNLFEKQDDFLNIEIADLLNRIQSCAENRSSLDEWIDFRNSKNKCRELGLGDYINQIENEIFDHSQIIPVFEKHFYKKWLDEIHRNFPVVQSFRGINHDNTINDFKNHDVLQLLIAQLRVKERLLSKYPNWETFTSATGELGILKRELNKKRRIMPIRKLFYEIPNLLLTIKPCLLMSPLSVSLFLESDKFNFDLVIFDEASQVRTEDAVGAIFRGKQVIIVGDSNQLPPTNFFLADSVDQDFDLDDDDGGDYYDDPDAFESVLDEAVSVIPERTLRWHYRSRHEQLIAFSNINIYHENLITFPSAVEISQNLGVEFVYVPDGIYARGGNRTNEKEASKVAELVMEHFSKTPERSLGVVTFSLAQANAIEEAVRKLRLKNQGFEQYFTEGNEESFFIKNLESVQGDERDTIIISVGYGKDHNGNLSMNFGPINRSGGYRRLNVVITRAKYNVKLVSSIKNSDFPTIINNNQGVNLLQAYLDYAQNRIIRLQNEIRYSKDIYHESPFEESVYKFLTDNGYKVATQVGCSGYRIDLAVEHPEIIGSFVLAIECDGASYHSARTARERDRLRQEKLEDIGWKFYRIWSTDWIKDPGREKQKLLKAIKDSIITFQQTKTVMENRNDLYENSESGQVENYYEIPINNHINTDNPFNFEYYQNTDIETYYEKLDGDNWSKYLRTIDQIIKNEYPIHKDYLFYKLLIFFNSDRLNNSIKKKVASHIQYYLEKEIELVDNFYWLKDKKIVKVRIPQKNDTPRKIEYISINELAEAMKVIIKQSFSIKKEDLIQATSKTFGFQRMGPAISKRLNTTFDYLIENKKIKEEDGKVTLFKK